MKNAIETVLHDNGLKITPARIAMLSLLSSAKKPLSIEAIQKTYPEMVTTTIYRILEKFVSKGVVYQTDFRDGKAYFEFQSHHHHHIACTSCGRKEEVDMCIDDKMIKVTKGSKHFKTVTSHMLEFFGICKACQN